MDRDTLLARLRAAEWDDFEVKEAAGGLPSSAFSTVSAFSNTSGGWLVFGARERDGGFDVTGVGDPEQLQGDFLGACRSNSKLSHPVDVRARWHDIDGKVLLAFYVPPAGRFERPVRVWVDRGWHAYVRLGSGDHRCTPREEARFLRDADTETFDGGVIDVPAFLGPALEAGLVERTVPQKPSSSRQRYRLTALGREIRAYVARQTEIR